MSQMFQSILSRPSDLKKFLNHFDRQTGISCGLLRRILYLDQPPPSPRDRSIERRYLKYLHWDNPIVFYFYLSPRQRKKFYQLLFDPTIIPFSEFDRTLLFWHQVEYEMKHYPRQTLYNWFGESIEIEDYYRIMQERNFIPQNNAHYYYQLYLSTRKWYLVVANHPNLLPRVVNYVSRLQRTRKRLVRLD